MKCRLTLYAGNILHYVKLRLAAKLTSRGQHNLKLEIDRIMHTWSGVPLTDVYGSSSPWGAPEFPLVMPAYNHAVLYHVTNTGATPRDKAPSPQRGQDKWDKECVRLPCFPQSLYPVEEEDGATNLVRRWDLIEAALRKPIRNSKDLAEAILSYNTKFKGLWKFRALHYLFNEYLEEEETGYFFDVTLPAIAKLALDLPQLIQSPIPLLRQHRNRSISLTQEQISSLLANAFFCTFPRRNNSKKTSEYASYPHINFNILYESSASPSLMEKLKCLCHYFRRVCTKEPTGVVTYTRHTVEPGRCPAWSDSRRLLSSVPLHVDSSGTIEDDGVGLIQVDFANKYLGGGVLNHGCVQEEIRFVICPELMLSMLFTEVLGPTESLIIIGCERYSRYTGYGSSFAWAGDYADDTPRDSSGRRRCVVLAIDALPFSRDSRQYHPDNILRELNKAWVGFTAYGDGEGALRRPGVATGNWGCGAFGGSPALKSLLQLAAAAEARRPIAYFTFGDTHLRDQIARIYQFLSHHHVTVGQLYKYLLRFSKTGLGSSELYPYIQQARQDEIQQTTKKETKKGEGDQGEEARQNCEQADVDKSDTSRIPPLVADDENTPDFDIPDDVDFESIPDGDLDATQIKADKTPSVARTASPDLFSSEEFQAADTATTSAATTASAATTTSSATTTTTTLATTATAIVPLTAALFRDMTELDVRNTGSSFERTASGLFCVESQANDSRQADELRQAGESRQANELSQAGQSRQIDESRRDAARETAESGQVVESRQEDESIHTDESGQANESRRADESRQMNESSQAVESGPSADGVAPKKVARKITDYFDTHS